MQDCISGNLLIYACKLGIKDNKMHGLKCILDVKKSQISARVCFSAYITPQLQPFHTECMNKLYEPYHSVTLKQTLFIGTHIHELDCSYSHTFLMLFD